MTFFSNRIYRINADGSHKCLGSPLNPHDRHGAYALTEWARRFALPDEAYDYIDNCWLKLTVERDIVVAYLREFSGDDVARAFIGPEECRSQKYIIEAEEF